MKLIYPLNLPFAISQKFGENPQYYNGIGLKGHNGVDFAIPVGTPVYATHDGTVTFAQVDSTMSLTISIDSLDGTFRTLYCHLSESKVLSGQKVKCGDLIALSGNTGRYTTGPHLHMGYKVLPVDESNGYNGASDFFNLFSGEYPKDMSPMAPPISTSVVLEFQAALKRLQITYGINDFENQNDLTKIKIGPKTITLLKKLKII